MPKRAASPNAQPSQPMRPPRMKAGSIAHLRRVGLTSRKTKSGVAVFNSGAIYAEFLAAAQKAAPACVHDMVRLALEGEDERVRVVAQQQVLQWAWGKPREFDPVRDGQRALAFDPSKLSPDELHIVEAALRMMLRASGTDDHREDDDQ
jgi:hypothetical protein